MARWLRFAVGFWLFVAFVVWNGFFDVLVRRGEHDYLLAQARHELGLRPEAVMDTIMRDGIRYAALVATTWAVVVFAAGLAGSVRVRRLTCREWSAKPSPPA